MGRHFAWGRGKSIPRPGTLDLRFCFHRIVFGLLFLLLLVIPLGLLSAQIADPGDPPQASISSASAIGRPVRRRSTAQPSANDIILHSFEFQMIYFGREGPNYKSLHAEPSKSAQQLAKAEIFGSRE